LEEGEFQADPLADFQTTENIFSVWLIEDDLSNLNRIITALAANCDHIQNIDYIIFDQGLLAKVGIQMQNSQAKTPDGEVNSNWHYDLIEISAQRLLRLVEVLIDRVEPQRVLQRQTTQWITDAVLSGQINIRDLKKHIREKIEPRI
jgi:hypothetical protein